jgi:hypothetical protein
MLAAQHQSKKLADALRSQHPEWKMYAAVWSPMKGMGVSARHATSKEGNQQPPRSSSHSCSNLLRVTLYWLPSAAAAAALS